MRQPRFLINVVIAAIMITSFSLLVGARAVATPVHAAGSVSFATWDSNPTEKTGQQKLVQAFEAKTGLHVDFQVLSGDYNAQLKSRITAGTAPDVFYINSDHIADYVNTNALKQLDFLAKDKSFGFNQFYKNLQQGYVFHKKTYALVKDYSTLALWVNKDLFRAKGIKSAPKTWKDLSTDACKLTDKSKKIYGISMSADPARWLAFVYAAGGDLLDKKQTKATINSPAGKAALDFYAGLVKKGCAARPDQVGAGWNGEAFGQEKTAMAIEGNWMTSYMQQTYPNVHWQIADLPKGPKTYGNLAFTAAYAMFARTSNLANATTLIKYLAGKQGEGTWAHAVSYLPSRKDVSPVAGLKVFTEQRKYAKDFFFPQGFADRALTPIGNDIRKVMEGSLSTSSALRDMQDQANKALQQAP